VGIESGPQKNDITNVFVHTRTAPNGDVWLVYGIETRSVNGNSYLDLEYNQAGVVLDGNKLTGKGSIGGRTVGDLLIIVDYEQGGKRPKVELRTWTAAGIWSSPSTPAVDGVTIYETINLSDELHLAPGAGFTGGGDPADVSMALQFVEGAINLTALGIIQTTECNISSTLNIKSRSSSSFTSELKDFVLFQFSFLEPPTVLVNSPVICEGKSATISADASGGKPPYQYQWTVPMGVPNPGNVASFTASVAGTYSVRVSDANQCKGDGSGTLKINPNTSSSQSRMICSNELPYSWDGLVFEAAGSKTKTGLINQFGCDSSATFNLTVNPTTSSTQSRTICSNELPYSWDGLIFEAAGSKTKTGLKNKFGCDSTATFNLAVNPTTSSTQSKTICSNQLPYSWDGLIFEAAGSKTKTGLKNQFGCDSTATFNLAVNPTTSSTQSKTICANELPYSWDGLVFEAAGSKSKTGLKNQFGCDSTANFNLIVNANPVCEISGPFTQAAAPLPNICIGGGQPAPVVYYKAPKGNYTYQWSVSEIGGAPFEPGSELLIIVGDANTAMVAVQVLGGGWLKLKITDNATGCASDCYVPVATTPNAACTLEGPAKACTNDVVTYTTTAVEGATYNWSIEGDAAIVSAMPYGNSIQVKAGGVGSYTVFLVITKEGECPSYCDWTTSVELCGLPYCTYTQGYFGNIGGIACTPQGPRTTTALITESLAAMPGGKLYLGMPGRSFTASTASYIIGILPGGGPATMLPAGICKCNHCIIPEKRKSK
ncbi:MAG: hypothetical protein FJX94_06645, partial [Bacteroidetes bacterium]|nr:hypothetical protein [Bacteroidota bacterium]